MDKRSRKSAEEKALLTELSNRLAANNSRVRKLHAEIAGMPFEPNDWIVLHKEVHAQMAQYHKGHERYETARRMSPQQWKDAWLLNQTTGKPFDKIIDDLRPFMLCSKEIDRDN